MVRVYELSDCRYREGAVSIKEPLLGNCSCLTQFYIWENSIIAADAILQVVLALCQTISSWWSGKGCLSQDIPGKTNNIFAVSRRQNTETCHINEIKSDWISHHLSHDSRYTKNIIFVFIVGELWRTRLWGIIFHQIYFFKDLILCAWQ